MNNIYLQQFKAAGIYRVVFDKSTMVNVNSEILRLVVGYSEQGPFNIPTYITNTTMFKTLYGDISKKLEKRGIWFHRLALQALASGPILALNLKKFENESVGAATIDTAFNTKFDAIDLEQLRVEDIYDTTRFWELSAEKLNDLRTVDGSKMDRYINIATTDTKQGSATFFIRKASGSSVSSYNVTLNDWYSDGTDVLPEYLEDAKNTLVSDYMAEIFVFKGKFTKEQVLASTSLKQHFTTDENGDLVLRKYELDAFGDPVDSLLALYNDDNSGALGHYVGSLIPYMKDKKGQYISLDIVFNGDQDVHSMMMSFNTDMLEDDTINLQISGKNGITEGLLKDICNGTAKVSILGNKDAEVVATTVKYINNVDKDGGLKDTMPFNAQTKFVSGTLYVTSIDTDDYTIELSDTSLDEDGNANNKVIINCMNEEDLNNTLDVLKDKNVLGADGADVDWADITPSDWVGKKLITSIKRITKATGDQGDYYFSDADSFRFAFVDIVTELNATDTFGHTSHKHIYNQSLTFASITDSWNPVATTTDSGDTITNRYVCIDGDDTLISVLSEGDCVLSETINPVTKCYEQAFVTTIDSFTKEDEQWFAYNNTIIDVSTYTSLNDNEKSQYIATPATVVTFTDTPLLHEDNNETDSSHTTNDGTSDTFIVRIDGDICQENGTLKPIYLEGFTYKNDRPSGTDMLSKLNWQKFILSALTDYKGLRTGLLNKSDVDYRYIIDTFETYVDSGVKKTLSYLAKEKQSAFAILNFPAVKTFVKCPYASFVNDKGIFNVQYVVDGYNKKKAHSLGFSLPSDDDGASFCAFYTPLKFSDGYVDNIVPSAALVSNLFMQKYLSRQPYYIIAGPNYGAINASGLVGPDYNYSMDELQIIEPYGVNCMVYRPSFGTFINANQTAKQTPLSALSRVNVRELVIYLQDEIEKVLQNYQWEFNNSVTRNAILDRANTICANIQANGGIQAYKNVMDTSNNTNEIIDNEMGILSTYIEPGFGCGKLVHELTIYKTGGLSSSISES